MLKICDFSAWLRSRYHACAMIARQTPFRGREDGSKDQASKKPRKCRYGALRGLKRLVGVLLVT